MIRVLLALALLPFVAFGGCTRERDESRAGNGIEAGAHEPETAPLRALFASSPTPGGVGPLAGIDLGDPIAEVDPELLDSPGGLADARWGVGPSGPTRFRVIGSQQVEALRIDFGHAAGITDAIEAAWGDGQTGAHDTWTDASGAPVETVLWTTSGVCAELVQHRTAVDRIARLSIHACQSIADAMANLPLPGSDETESEVGQRLVIGPLPWANETAPVAIERDASGTVVALSFSVPAHRPSSGIAWFAERVRAALSDQSQLEVTSDGDRVRIRALPPLPAAALPDATAPVE